MMTKMMKRRRWSHRSVSSQTNSTHLSWLSSGVVLTLSIFSFRVCASPCLIWRLWSSCCESIVSRLRSCSSSRMKIKQACCWGCGAKDCCRSAKHHKDQLIFIRNGYELSGIVHDFS